MKRTFVFAFTLAAFMLALPAQAHDIEDLEQWRADWQAEVLETGLTPEAMAEWQDMKSRHGCDWPGTNCIILPHQDRIVTSPPSTNTSWGGDVEQWRPLVEAYFQPVDVPWAMRVMACESGGNPNAKNPTSTASGLFQFLRGWWSGAWGGTGAFDPFNPEQNVKAAAWLFYNGGPGHWVCR